MHIPDGYLGPQTYVPLYGVMVGLWSYGLHRVQRTLRLRQVPLLALGAAFCFVIMMFNVPIPGGSSGHAVGGALVAILLGPWAAMLAVSLALVLQAFVFGDGGITAIGANCFNMAVVLPVVGWGVYRLIASGAPASSRRHWLGAALGGYVGLTAAAIVAGVEFGLQPLLAVGPDGQPLYCPFGLSLAVAAMAVEHLLAFGLVEAAATALVVAYFQRTAPGMLPAAAGGAGAREGRWLPTLATAMGILVLLSPLGLIVPDHFGSGAAWGEWDAKQVQEQLAKDAPAGAPVPAVPAGLARAAEHGYQAPMPDYAFRGWEDAAKPKLWLAYVLAALLGVAALGGLVWWLARFIARKEPLGESPPVDAGPHGA